MPLELLIAVIPAGTSITGAMINAAGRIAAVWLARSEQEVEAASGGASEVRWGES